MSRDGSRLRLGAVVLFAVLMVSATVVPVLGHGGVTSGAVASESQWAAPASVLGAEAGSVENRRIARTLIQESNMGSEAKRSSLDALNVTIEGHVGPNRTKADPFAEDRQIVRATKDEAPKATVAILDAEAALARTALDDAVRARDELEARNHSSDADLDIKGHYKYDTDVYIEIKTTKYDGKNITRLSDNTDEYGIQDMRVVIDGSKIKTAYPENGEHVIRWYTDGVSGRWQRYDADKEKWEPIKKDDDEAQSIVVISPTQSAAVIRGTPSVPA